MLSICGCSSQQQASMGIKPSEFSKETKEVLELFDDEIQFFDITLDDSVKSQSIVIWVYQNGEWNEAGRTEGETKFLSNRIAIRLTENSYDLYTMDENGHIKYSFPNLTSNFENSTATGGKIIDKEIPLELNKETPIWFKIGTDKDSMSVGDIMFNFRQIDCNAGIAITLTVSDRIIE